MDDAGHLPDRLLEEHDGPHHLDPAPRRARARREARQEDHPDGGEPGPLREVDGGETRRRGDGHHVEGRVAQCRGEVGVGSLGQQEGRDAQGRSHHPQEHAPRLHVGDVRGERAAAHGDEMRREIEACRQHEGDSHGLDRLRVEVGEARVARGEAAQAHGREAVDDRVHPRHAGQAERDDAREGHDRIHRPEPLGGVADSRRELGVLHAARALRLEELAAAHAQERQDGHRQDDDPHAADPDHERAPDVERGLQRVQAGEDRGPGGRHARDGLEVGVREGHARDREEERDGGEGGHHRPDEGDQQEAVARLQLAPVPAARDEEGEEPGHEGDEEPGLEGRVRAIGQREGKRDGHEEGGREEQHRPREHVQHREEAKHRVQGARGRRRRLAERRQGDRHRLEEPHRHLEELLDLGDHALLREEDDDVVVGLDHVGVVLGHDDLVAADDPHDGGARRQVDLADAPAHHARGLAVAVRDELQRLGSPAPHAVHGADVAAPHVLEEAAEGGLRRRDGDVDLPALHEVAVGAAVDEGDHAARAHALGEERRHDVRLVVVGDRDEEVGLVHALVAQQVLVAHVPVEHQRVGELPREVLAAALRGLDHLHVHAAIERAREPQADVAAAGDDDPRARAGPSGACAP